MVNNFKKFHIFTIKKYNKQAPMENLLYTLNIGDELYSPICGTCKVITLDYDEIFCITVRTPYGADFNFDCFGRFALGGTPLLFHI